MRAISGYCVAAVVSIIVTACGGGSGTGTTTPPVVNQSVGGIWRAQYTASNGDSVTEVGLASETGSFYLESKNDSNDCAGVSLGTLTVSGNSVIGTAKAALVSFAVGGNVQTDCVYSDGSTSASFTVTGTVTQRSQLVLTATGTTSGGTALPSQTVTYTYDSSYSESSSLGKVAGTWSNWTDANSATTSIDSNLTAFLYGWASSAPGQGTITIDASGAISANDVTIDGEGLQEGCTTGGQVSIINQYYNMYSFTATITCYNGNPEAQFPPSEESGLMYLDTTVTPNKLVGGGTVTNLEADSNDTEVFTAIRQ